MKLKRKAVEVNPLAMLGGMILIGLVLMIAVLFVKNKTTEASEIISSLQMSSRNQLCGAKGKDLFNTGTLKEPIEGDKGDDFPDDCDMCLGGDNKVASNSYGVPDGCYMQPTKENGIKNYKDMCKAKGGCYISDTDQCCIGEAKNRCGQKCK